MPGMDGLEVLTRLRALDAGVPVIMLTAHGSERVAVAAMKAGAHHYLPKPFDPDELVLAVRRAIETRTLRQQNALLRTEATLGRTVVAASPGEGHGSRFTIFLPAAEESSAQAERISA